MKRYLAYDADGGEHEMFDTIEEAKQWLTEGIEEGVGTEFESGNCFIAKVVLRSSFKITEKKEDYPEGEWPYNSDFDHIGKAQWFHVGSSETQSPSGDAK